MLRVVLNIFHIFIMIVDFFIFFLAYVTHAKLKIDLLIIDFGLYQTKNRLSIGFIIFLMIVAMVLLCLVLWA